MLISVQHKTSTVKNDNISFTYHLVDSDEYRDITFSMPIKVSIQLRWVTPLAIHQAYYKQGKEVVRQALSDWYGILQREGNDVKAIRAHNLQYYKQVITMLTQPDEPVCKGIHCPCQIPR